MALPSIPQLRTKRMGYRLIHALSLHMDEIEEKERKVRKSGGAALGLHYNAFSVWLNISPVPWFGAKGVQKVTLGAWCNPKTTSNSVGDAFGLVFHPTDQRKG